MSIVTAILAGGAGQRIGGAKPDRLLAGNRLLIHALKAARGWGAPTIMVLRDPAQISDVLAPVVLDNPDIPGPLGGLASALAWAATNDADRVLTLPCDMPFLPDDLLSRLDHALTDDIAVAVAASGGRLHPICALWQAGDGRLSLNGLSEAAGRVIVDWPITQADPFLNINTLEDLASAEALTA